MQLSKHFTLEDLTVTNTGLDNTPTSDARNNLQKLALLLDIIYDQIGPFSVTSAYRSDAVNNSIGGATGSYHTLGIAADLSPFNDTPYDFFVKILNSSIFDKVGELINEADEKGVVHVSLPSFAKRSVAMYLKNGNYLTYSQSEINNLRNKPSNSDSTISNLTIISTLAAVLATVAVVVYSQR